MPSGSGSPAVVGLQHPVMNVRGADSVAVERVGAGQGRRSLRCLGTQDVDAASGVSFSLVELGVYQKDEVNSLFAGSTNFFPFSAYRLPEQVHGNRIREPLPQELGPPHLMCSSAGMKNGEAVDEPGSADSRQPPK